MPSDTWNILLYVVDMCRIEEILEKNTCMVGKDDKAHIDLKSEIFLLEMIPESYSKEKAYLIIHILTAARIIFVQNWKSEKIPIEEDVIRKILECAEMNRLTLAIKEKEQPEYYIIWALFYQWLEKKYES
uniref:Uncharacterized protein n=1 Tax=Micrurus carvalhoi TaxID=3147026 RepID=A0A2H6N7W3_9SAUR